MSYFMASFYNELEKIALKIPRGGIPLIVKDNVLSDSFFSHGLLKGRRIDSVMAQISYPKVYDKALKLKKGIMFVEPGKSSKIMSAVIRHEGAHSIQRRFLPAILGEYFAIKHSLKHFPNPSKTFKKIIGSKVFWRAYLLNYLKKGKIFIK